MSKHAILVVGDVMLDRRIEGKMTRISPESPSPVILQEGVTLLAGGAGNVAANVAALGRKTYLAGVAGTDASGDALQDLLLREYEINANIVRRPELTTVVKNRVTCGGQQVLRVDEEAPWPSGEAHNADLLQALAAVVGHEHSDIALIVVADYNKGTLTDTVIRFLKDAAWAQQIPIFVDCKPSRADQYQNVALLKPNLSEARQMCDHLVHPAMADGVNEEDQAEVMAREIHSRYQARVVIITRGSNGATVFDGSEFFTSTVSRQDVFDVTGAGDTFLAVLADAHIEGRDLPSAVLRANTGAGLACAHHGTFVLGRDELEESVKKRLGPLGKILSLEDAQQLVRRRRRRDQRIVMTNGCFRTLHHGHLSTLQWARHRGDLLVVAINSDDAIRQLKGEEKPLIPQTYRATMLAQLPYVDAVVIFDHTDVTDTVKAIQPDILVKGAEYKEAVVPGADYVASRGGEVLFAPMLAGVSSTVLDGATA